MGKNSHNVCGLPGWSQCILKVFSFNRQDMKSLEECVLLCFVDPTLHCFMGPRVKKTRNES